MKDGVKYLSFFSLGLIALFIGFVLIRIVCRMEDYADTYRIYMIYTLVLSGLFGIVCAIGFLRKKGNIKIDFLNRRF